jgi:hypothetical protein
MNEIKVGDYLWRFDMNASKVGRGLYKKEKIIGETTRSWLVGGKFAPMRVSKKTFISKDPHYGDTQWFASEQEGKDREWVSANKYRISDKVKFVRDAKILKKIDEMIKE